MGSLCVSLFGKFDVRCDGRVLTSLDVCKMQELFCYLLLFRERPHPRETLASLLWSDKSTAQSKRYLRKALWQLQAILEPLAGSINGHLLLVEPSWIQINSEADFWLDVAAFEEAFHHTEGVPGRELDAGRVQTLRYASDLYQGDLLEGWYQDWCLYERERLQHQYLAILDKLMDYCEAHGECETGLAYGTRILRYDLARERTHRRLMRLHYLAGDRTAALRQYKCCVRALEEELGVGPAKRTLALCEQIQMDQIDVSTSAVAEVDTAPEAAASPLPEVLGHLKQLQSILSEVQHKVQGEIESIELALSDRS